MSQPELVEAALSSLGQGSVILRHCHTQNLRWANSALTTNGDTIAQDMTVIATQPHEEGYRLAVVSGQAPDHQTAVDLARRATEQCRDAAPVPGARLPDGIVDADFTRDPERIDPDDGERVLDTVRGLLQAPHRQFGYAETDCTTTYMATTAGTRFRHVQPTLRFEACARDDTGSTWWGSTSLDTDVASVLDQQSASLGHQGVAGHLPPGRHRVILTPSALADLMVYLAWSASGRDAVEGQNVFSRPGGGTLLGERLTDRPVTVYADPAHPGLQCADRVIVDVDGSTESVFDNGLALGRQDLIRDGVLTALRASRPTAREFGLPPVYLADNLIVSDASGSGTEGELLSRTDDAVLITCLWYIREVDRENLLLTGLTRDGVYCVRDGQIVGSLPNFRFNVSVPEVLANISDASATTNCLPREWADYFTRAAMPAVCVEGFNLSSPSEAW